MTTAPVTTEDTTVAPYEASAVVPYDSSSLSRVESTLAAFAGDAPQKVVSTYSDQDEESALAVFAAVSDASDLKNHLGEVIELVHVVLQAVTMNVPATKHVDEHTVDITRTILIDKDGNAYGTSSETILKSLETMFALLGKPQTWKTPKSVTVVEKEAKLGKFFSLMPVINKKK